MCAYPNHQLAQIIKNQEKIISLLSSLVKPYEGYEDWLERQDEPDPEPNDADEAERTFLTIGRF